MSLLHTLAAVDGVEITTIMDNCFDALLGSSAVARRVPLRQDFFERPQLRAEHGVSTLITVINPLLSNWESSVKRVHDANELEEARS